MQKKSSFKLFKFRNWASESCSVKIKKKILNRNVKIFTRKKQKITHKKIKNMKQKYPRKPTEI